MLYTAGFFLLIMKGLLYESGINPFCKTFLLQCFSLFCRYDRVSLGKVAGLTEADVPQNMCSYKIRKFHRKTPVLESPLFNKVKGLNVFSNKI